MRPRSTIRVHAALVLWMLCLCWACVAAEPGWTSTRLSGLELRSEPVAMQWDASSRLWLLEREWVAGVARSQIRVVDFIASERNEVRSQVWAHALPDSTGFEVSTSAVWLAAGSRLLRLNGSTDSRVTDRATPWIGWGTPSGRAPVFKSLHWHRDGWIYGVMDAEGLVTPQLLEQGLVAPAKLRPGVIRFHPSRKILEQFTEGPLSPQALDFNPAGDMIIVASSRAGLYYGFAGCVAIPQDGYPRPAHGMLDVQDSMTPASFRKPGAVSLVWESRGGGPGSTPGKDVLWLRYSNSSSWFPVVTESSGATVAILSSAASPHLMQGVAEPTAPGVMGPLGSLIFRSQGGLVRMALKPDRGEGMRIEKETNLNQLTSEDLSSMWSASSEPWVSQRIQRTFLERQGIDAMKALRFLCTTSTVATVRAAALQIYAGKPDASLEVIRQVAADRSSEVRMSVARALGEGCGDTAGAWGLLVALASDADPRIRREVALATRRAVLRSSSRSSVYTPRDVTEAFQALGPILLTTARSPEAMIQSVVWSALEPLAQAVPLEVIEALRALGETAVPATGPQLKKAVRATFESGEDKNVDRVLERLLLLADESPALCAFGLEGMMQGQKTSKAWTGHKGVKRLLRKLAESGNAELAGAAQRVDAMCGNPRAQTGLLAKISNESLSDAERLKSIEFTRWVPSDEARSSLWELLRSRSSVDLKLGAVDSLREMGTMTDAGSLLVLADQVVPELRAAILTAFESREVWWSVLLGGVEAGKVNRTEIPSGWASTLRHHPNLKLRSRALSALGAEN